MGGGDRRGSRVEVDGGIATGALTQYLFVMPVRLDSMNHGPRCRGAHRARLRANVTVGSIFRADDATSGGRRTTLRSTHSATVAKALAELAEGGKSTGIDTCR